MGHWRHKSLVYFLGLLLPVLAFSQGHPPAGGGGSGASSFSQLTGKLNPSTQIDTGTSSISLTAGGLNQNITLAPSGTGSVNIPTNSGIAVGQNLLAKLQSDGNNSLTLIGNAAQMYISNVVPASRPGVQKYAFRTALNTVAFSATPTFDATAGNFQKITLTGNVTSSTLSGAVSGQFIYFLICQDAAGSHTFVWPTNVLGGMTIGSTASKCSAQSFISDGTNAYALSSGVADM